MDQMWSMLWGERWLLRSDKLLWDVAAGNHAAVAEHIKNGAYLETRFLPSIGVFNNGTAEVKHFSKDHVLVLYEGLGQWYRWSDITRTALQTAADNGDLEMVTMLVKAGAVVNGLPAGAFGRTALQAAAGKGHLEIVKLLLDPSTTISSFTSPPLETILEAEEGDEDQEVLPVDPEGADTTQTQQQQAGQDESLPEPPVEPEIDESASSIPQETASSQHPEEPSIDVEPIDESPSTQEPAENQSQEVIAPPGYVKADINAPPATVAGRTALQAAAEGGHLDMVKLLIDSNADVNAPPATASGRTALQAAAGGGHLEVVKLLIEAGALVNAPPSTAAGRTALQAAVQGGHLDVAKFLIDDHEADANQPPARYYGITALRAALHPSHTKLLELLKRSNVQLGPQNDFGQTIIHQLCMAGRTMELDSLFKTLDGLDLNRKDIFGSTPLHTAVRNNQLSDIESILKPLDTFRLNLKDSYGSTPLHLAVRGNHDTTVSLLVKKLDVLGLNIKDHSRSTPLHLAVAKNNKHIVEYLLKKLDVFGFNLKDQYGYTPLQIAVQLRNRPIVELLLWKVDGIGLTTKDGDRHTPLHIAVKENHEPLVRLLVKKLDLLCLNAKDRSGSTPLHIAVQQRSRPIVQSLLKKIDTLSLSTKNHSRSIPLDIAVKENNEPAIALLVKKTEGHGVNAKDHSGSTPLHIAVKEKEQDIIKLLLAKGARADIKDNFDKSPLELALGGGSTEVLDLLLEEGGSTHDLDFSKWLKLVASNGLATNAPPAVRRDSFILRGSGTKPKNITQSGLDDTIIRDLRKAPWTSPSLILIPQILGGQLANFQPPIHPTAYLKDYYVNATKPDGYDPSVTKDVDWAWLILDTQPAKGNGANNPTLAPRIPSYNEIFTLKPAKESVLIGYVRFSTPVHDSDGAPTTLNGEKPGTHKKNDTIKTFKYKLQPIEISWIMGESHDEIDKNRGQILRSIHYRGTLKLKYFTVPRNAVEFFILFLNDVRNTWLSLFENARSHLAHMRDSQVESEGENPEIIHLLLKDRQQWNVLHKLLKKQVTNSKKLLDDFNEYDVLYTELMDADDRVEAFEDDKVVKETGGKAQDDGIENIGQRRAIDKLSKKIKTFKDDCNKAISELQNETKEMIELELSLITVLEARKSIEVANSSNSMAMSMQRLTWISIVFLPLSFVTGIFGMNVDVLTSNPSWGWYFAFALPIMALVIITWILFKNMDIPKRIDNKIKSLFQRVTNEARTRQFESGKRSRDLAAIEPTGELLGIVRYDFDRTQFPNYESARSRSQFSDDESDRSW